MSSEPTNIEVTQRYSFAQTGDRIPREVVDAFHAAGYRATIASRMAEVVPQLGAYHRYPASDDELKMIRREAVVPKKSGDPEIPAFHPDKALTRAGFRKEKDTGYYYMGDCYLYIQPLDAFYAQERLATEMWMAQDDPDGLTGKLQDLNDGLYREGLRGTREGIVYPLHPIEKVSSHLVPTQGTHWKE